MSAKEKSSWRNIPIKINTSGPQDLICFEELIDYEMPEETTQSPVIASQKTGNSNKKKRRLQRLKELKEKKRRLLDENEDSNELDKEKHGTGSSESDKTINKKSVKTKKRKRVTKQKTKVTNLIKKVVPKEVDNVNLDADAKDIDMSAWDPLLVPDEIRKALMEMSFTEPTQVQKEVIKTAIQRKVDIVAAAETGSGKTLAFGIPLLHHMMEDRARGLDEVLPNLEDETKGFEDDDDLSDQDNEDVPEDNVTTTTPLDKILSTLILAPTRELAIQVKDHLIKVGKYTNFKIVAIVGGMSVQKQERILRNKPDIVIATPGRLWEFIQQGHDHLTNLHLLRYLVIDEADRMLEKGHFEELVKILDVVNNKEFRNTKRQSYMFSATLTTVHQTPSRLKAKAKSMTKTVKLETLMSKIGIKEQKHVVDLTTKKGTAENLYEAKIICAADEKDLYMYYFIRSHPGRTLVFTNSIDCIFHISGVLQALSLTPLQLHAKMQQRQRLKHLERFRADPNAILIASDVAARGLDITDVQHVIHYQVPRTCETYIHRSGRSARTGKEGLSLLLVSPEEISFYKRLCSGMKLENGIPKFPYDEYSLSASKKIVKLAKEVDSLTHRKKKVRLNNDWFSKAAAEMDIELDDDMLMKDEDTDDDDDMIIKQKQKHLELLLKRPILPRSFSGKFLTKSGKLDLPRNKKQTSAIEEVKKVTKKRV